MTIAQTTEQTENQLRNAGFAKKADPVTFGQALATKYWMARKSGHVADAEALSAQAEAMIIDLGPEPVEAPEVAQVETDVMSAVLDERGARYGTFEGHAQVAQELKAVVSSSLAARGKVLAPDQAEALDMIMHKVARIINGDPNYDDSWVDICGYSQLIVDRLRGKVR
jgi:uncharacterized protein YfaQ (DUF2300 family)